MKQSEWKDHIEFIEAEMLKRGSKQGAPEILKQFGTRLSSTIHHFFEESNLFINTFKSNFPNFFMLIVLFEMFFINFSFFNL